MAKRISDSIEKLIAELEKQAASGVPDPGTAEGESQHPTADETGGRTEPTEGPLQKEEDEVVKDQTGDIGVTEDKPEPAQNVVEDNPGDLKPSGVGEDPEAEDDHDVTKVQEKLASLSVEEIYKQASEILENIEKQATGESKTASSEDGDKYIKIATEELAEAASVQAEATAVQVISQFIKQARHQADLVAAVLKTAQEELEEQEKEEPAEEEKEESSTSESEGAEDASIEELLNMIETTPAGEEEEETEETPVEPEVGEEEVPSADEIASVLNAAGAEESIPPDEAMQDLSMALMELGIDPAELAEATNKGAAVKIASAVKNYRRSGKFRVEEAKTAKSRKLRDHIKQYILELVS